MARAIVEIVRSDIAGTSIIAIGGLMMAELKSTGFGAALTAILLAGCASSSDKIAAAYVSPNQFNNYRCDQLSEEAQRISQHVARVSGIQDQKASNDAVATGVALVVFWPAALLISGNDQNSAELARLKGEMEAIEKMSIQKSCGIQFRRDAPPPRA